MSTTPRNSQAVKDRYLTIRIPSDIDQQLRRLAAANTRTLAAQVLHYIKQGMANEKNGFLKDDARCAGEDAVRKMFGDDTCAT